MCDCARLSCDLQLLMWNLTIMSSLSLCLSSIKVFVSAHLHSIRHTRNFTFETGLRAVTSALIGGGGGKCIFIYSCFVFKLISLYLM